MVGEVLQGKMGLILGIVFVIIFVLILCASCSIRAQLKKAFLILVTIAVLAAGYYLVTGRSATEIPHLVSAFFNGPQVPETVSHRYYQDPKREAEAMGDD